MTARRWRRQLRPRFSAIKTEKHYGPHAQLERPFRPEAAAGSSGGLDVTSAEFLERVKMDALRAREHLRRRYPFSSDAKASLDGEGHARPGEALSRARSGPRRGARRRGPRKRPASRASRSPAPPGGVAFHPSGLTPSCFASRAFGAVKDPWRSRSPARVHLRLRFGIRGSAGLTPVW